MDQGFEERIIVCVLDSLVCSAPETLRYLMS